MKSADRRALLASVRDAEPSFTGKWPLLHLPIDALQPAVLRAIYFESSAATPNAVYVWVFVQPLYVPESSVTFNLGHRLGGGTKLWTKDDASGFGEVIRVDALPFLRQFSGPRSIATYRPFLERTDAVAREAVAYSLIDLTSADQAKQALDDLRATLRADIPWMAEMRRRAAHLSALLAEDPPLSRAQLMSWQENTIKLLKVTTK